MKNNINVIDRVNAEIDNTEAAERESELRIKAMLEEAEQRKVKANETFSKALAAGNTKAITAAKAAIMTVNEEIALYETCLADKPKKMRGASSDETIEEINAYVISEKQKFAERTEELVKQLAEIARESAALNASSNAVVNRYRVSVLGRPEIRYACAASIGYVCRISCNGSSYDIVL